MIRTAIIGYGKVAHLHARALKASSRGELVAVQGRDQEKASAFAGQYGAKGFTDLERMIRDEGIQAVLVCTPHPAHADSAVIAAEMGVHVLVEKPLASSLTDCDAILDAARKTGVKLGVISQRRFYEAARQVRSAIDDGKIGKPILGTVTMLSWRDQAYYESDPWRGTWQFEGGGVLVNQSPHPFDLLLWYMGPIAQLTGYWDNLTHPYIEVDDTAVAIIRFKSGALGNIVVSNSQNPALYGNVHVHGSNGASVGVQTERGAMFIAGMTGIPDPASLDLWTIPGEEQHPEQCLAADRALFATIDPTVHYIALQIEDFMEAIEENRAPLVTGEDGRAVVELFTAIYGSQRDHMPINFPL
jgi:UDP-N-acetyl-2-amino-2-deoxyglucuronate dehydrogenase